MSAAAGAKTILIVDDNNDIRETLGEILIEEGYAVAKAQNGQEAIDWLRRAGERPDLILLDLMMPVLNGWQFRALQKQDPALAPIPVVLMSAYGSKDSATALDARAYVAKPIQLDDLLETLKKHCA